MNSSSNEVTLDKGGPNSLTGTFIGRKTPREDRGRERSDTTTSQGMPRMAAASGSQKGEKGLSPGPSEGEWPS